MGRGIDSQPGKVYSSESIPWFLKRLQIQAQLGGGRGKAAPLKSRGFPFISHGLRLYHFHTGCLI